MLREFLSIAVLERWIGVSRISIPVLRVGFDGGWVNDHQVVQVELCRYERGENLDGKEELLAFLLSDELEVVAQLLQDDDRSEELDPAIPWFYSAGMELKSAWEQRSAPGEDLYEILEALGLDEQFRDLVYFEPVRMFTRKAGVSHLKGLLDLRLNLLRPHILSPGHAAGKSANDAT